MKRVLALLMVALLALSLCACGEPTVEEVLNGSIWEINTSIGTYALLTHWEFNDGRFYQYAEANGSRLGTAEGNYIVNGDGTLTIDWDDPDDDDRTFYYIYENGVLTMSTQEDMSIKMERVN